MLDIGIKASLTGITAMALKDVADRITADELNHITALSTAGNPAITGDYLSSLQDKYAPVHTGNPQLADTTLRNTGGNLPLAPHAPNHTGNNQISGQGATHTGVTDSGIKTTITPILDGPSRDDLAYLSLKGKEAQEAADKLGFDRRIPPQKAPFNSHGKPVFFNGKNYITPDVDSHNVKNGWKMVDRKGERMGTYDSHLNRIKD